MGSLVVPSLARGADPRRVRSVAVGTLGFGPRRLAVPDGCRMVGVGWAAPGAPRLSLRVRTGSGWGPWVAAGAAGHGPGRFGEPLWLGEAGEVELRAAQPTSGVVLHFIADGGGGGLLARAAAFPRAQPILQTGGGQPAIIARDAWAGAGHPPRFGPNLGTVELAFVHHTENPNGYSAADVPALLRSIYTYHHDVRGWSDIGYNFVIDQFGRAWEARFGGIDLAVVGSHAGGYNEFSTGAAVLGSFSGSPPSAAALRTLQRLLAWKLSLHGAPVHGDVQVVVGRPLQAGETRYAPGTRARLARISGHRDGDFTDCPGDALYARLPAVRRAARARVGDQLAALTLEGPAANVRARDPFVLSGRLTDPGGAGMAQQTVVLQDITELTRAPIEQLSTDATGRFATTLARTGNLVVRAERSGPPAAVSDAVFVFVSPVLSLAVGSLAPPVLEGQISPAKPHVTVQVSAGGKVVETHRVPVTQGRFSVAISRRPPFTAVARSAEDDFNAAGASPRRVVSG